MGRDDLVNCSEGFEDDFYAKEVNTPEVSKEDLANLKCLPADQFSLFRDAAEGAYSSVNIVVSECGGKFTEP